MIADPAFAARPWRHRGALFAAVALTACAQENYDIVIDNALVVDGSGAPGRYADLAIVGDRIVRIEAQIDTGLAARVIAADGLVAAPGFIEPHAHITDIESRPLAENYLRQGVTTIANTLHSVDQPYPMGEFLDRIDVAPNTLWTAGHTWIRKQVMGLADREPSAAEFREMLALVEEAMQAGAIGLGTGLEYVPANYAKLDEVIELARATQSANALYVTHLRDEGARLMEALEEALAVGRAAQLPVHISHIKNTGVVNWSKTPEVIDYLESGVADGVEVSYDVYPYTAYSTYSDVLFPSWVLADGREAYRERIADPVLRARLAIEMQTIFRAQTAGTPDSVQFRDLEGFVGLTLGDYLAARGQPLSIETAVDALIELQADGGFIGIFEAMAEDDVVTFLRHPLASVSADGSLVTPGEGHPHPRSYGAFPRVLGHYVRERQTMSLEAAIARMTSVTAKSLMLVDRGELAAGSFADVVLFDPQIIGDCATFAKPHCYSEGVVYLLINGVLAIDDGKLTGAKPGIPLRRSGWSR